MADREQPDPVTHEEPNRVSREDSLQATAALGVAALGVILYVLAIFIAEGRNEWLWPLALVLGAAGAIMGWMAGRPRPQGRALAVVAGGLICALTLLWAIVAAITGDWN